MPLLDFLGIERTKKIFIYKSNTYKNPDGRVKAKRLVRN